MERELKFRAWDRSLKKFRYPKLWDSSMPSNWKDWYESQQFTGLLDRNKVEIYEGDVVRFDERVASVGVVVYDGDSFKAKMPAFGIYWKLFHKGKSKKNRVEVIGNVFENPDLLQ